jgi:HEAT repeat protein
MANQDGRNEAGRVLKALGSKENVGVNLALAGLKDNDPGRRREAADTLAKMPAPDKGKQAEVAGALEMALNDPDPGVRERAAKALVVWATPENVAGLLKVIDDQNHWIRVHAMTALGKLQDDRAVAAIAARLTVGEDRRDASAALQALGPKAELEVLKYLQSSEEDVVIEVCRILKVIGTKLSVKTLRYVAQVAAQLKKQKLYDAAVVALQECSKR